MWIFIVVFCIPIFFIVTSIIRPYLYLPIKKYYDMRIQMKGYPHKVWENVLEWEPGDEFYIEENDSFDILGNNNSGSRYTYKGINDDYEVIFQNRYGSEITKFEISELFSKFDAENISLKNKKNSGERIKEELEKSKYMDFLEDMQKAMIEVENYHEKIQNNSNDIDQGISQEFLDNCNQIDNKKKRNKA